METIRESVRFLVEFILRSGDITRAGSRIDPEAMQKGARLHRKLQKQMGSGYRPEVSLKEKTDFEDLSIQIEGRADGVFTWSSKMADLKAEGFVILFQPDTPFFVLNEETPDETDDSPPVCWVDEIKGIYQDPAQLSVPFMIHVAQALCYARMLFGQEETDRIGLQLTYAHLDTEEVRRFRTVLGRQEVADWYQRLLCAYHRWVSFRLSWETARNASMKGLEFPFSYRPGQQRMVRSVYHAIRVGRQIFMQAPTGIGKTMSTVFPAVRAVGEGYGKVLFYLTARTTTRIVAQEAFDQLRERGLRYKVITLTAREKLCPMETTRCDPDQCTCAKGHFDRVNEAVFELWIREDVYDRETILAHAARHQVCPFEMSLDLAVWTDAVIGDYNYVFDPDVSLKRFFGEGGSGEYIFLIDEAHNLVERSREMYSASLSLERIREAAKTLRIRDPDLTKTLRRAQRQLTAKKKELEGEKRTWIPTDLPETMKLTLQQARGEFEALMDDSDSGGFPEELLDFYFELRTFLNVTEVVDEGYSIFIEQTGKDLSLHLMCVNPAARLAERLGRCRSAVFFSATFHPLAYYRRLLSRREDDYGIYFDSPFARENRLILVGRDVTSRYRARGEEVYDRIARYIAVVTSAKRGNYLVFFPSYRMLEDVRQIYESRYDKGQALCLSQTPSMTENEREAFLKVFEKAGSVIGFAIMGGIFS